MPTAAGPGQFWPQTGVNMLMNEQKRYLWERHTHTYMIHDSWLIVPYMANGLSSAEVFTAQVGTGGFLGFSMGYFMKKISKLLLFLTGMVMTVAAYLELTGTLNINWTGLANSIGAAFAWLTRGHGNGSLIGTTQSLVGVVPLGGSFAAATLIGFKYG